MAASAGQTDNNVLFEDVFDVRQSNRDGKKFDRVDRLHCRATTYEVDFVVDVNSELFSVSAGDRITATLASSVSLMRDDPQKEDGSFVDNRGITLLDSYEYAMYGRVFDYTHEEGAHVSISISCGGLLANLRGLQSELASLQMDQVLYLLLRRGTAAQPPMQA